MMKIIFLTIFLLCCSLVEAQVIVKDFFDKNGMPSNEQDSYYYQVGEKALIEVKVGLVTKRDTAFIDTVKTFYTATHRIRSREFYQDGWREGAFMVYHENGRLKDKGRYHEGQKVGYLTSWYETGVVHKILKYVPAPSGTLVPFPQDSVQLINYWNESNVQLVKDGSGFCACYLDSDQVLEKGKVVNGTRDSTWQYLLLDTVKFVEEFKMGKFLEGKAYYKGKEIKYNQVVVTAEFPGGLTAMMKYLRGNVRYPSYARRKGIQGKVFTKFIVDKDGSLTELATIKGVSKELDDEAIRVIKSMPRWLPGTMRGIPVKSQFVLPIYFNLGR